MKKKTGSKIISSPKWAWPALLSLSLLQACFEPIEGCLDVVAINFELDADKACLDCCTYPLIRLDFQHKVVLPDTTLNLVLLESVFEDSQGNPFTLKNIQFYLSNFHFIRGDGSGEPVENTIALSIFLPDGETELKSVEDNFSLISPGVFSTQTIGTFRLNGRFNKLRFAIGVEGIANRVDPNSLPEDHPLSLQDDPMYWSRDSGYIFNKIEIFRDTTAADTIASVLEIGTEEFLRVVEIPFVFDVTVGFNTRVSLSIDYQLWFKDINVKTDTEAEMINKIVVNIPESFSVIEIKAE